VIVIAAAAFVGHATCVYNWHPGMHTGLVYGGRGTIVWDQSQDAFPYHTGKRPILL
jgi:hypothetical protein